jgi:hypothetical protein
MMTTAGAFESSVARKSRPAMIGIRKVRKKPGVTIETGSAGSSPLATGRPSMLKPMPIFRRDSGMGKPAETDSTPGNAASRVCSSSWNCTRFN